MHPLALSWAGRAGVIWVVGGLGNLKESIHRRWLSTKEIQTIGRLKCNQLWVRSNESGESAVVSINQTADLKNTAAFLRQQAARDRKLMPVRQMADAAALLVRTNSGETDLYSRLCQRETLRLGWFKVQSGAKNSYGTDGVTVARFKEDLEKQLEQLAHDLNNKKYRCKSLRRIHIPKPDGGKRPIGMVCVRDRVVQAACLLLLEPVFEPGFSPRSFAFRPGRSARQALAMARCMIAEGRTWIVIADIKKAGQKKFPGVRKN